MLAKWGAQAALDNGDGWGVVLEPKEQSIFGGPRDSFQDGVALSKNSNSTAESVEVKSESQSIASELASPQHSLAEEIGTAFLMDSSDEQPAIFREFSYHGANTDLALWIGKSPIIEFKVASEHLVESSEVFRSMFNGSWKERKPTSGEPWVVKLPEDEPNAFDYILRILHGWGTEEITDPDLLYGVVVTTNYYDLYPKMRQVAGQLLSALCRMINHNPLTHEHRERLFLVALELGQKHIVQDSLRHLLKFVKYDANGELTTARGHLPEFRSHPTGPYMRHVVESWYEEDLAMMESGYLYLKSIMVSEGPPCLKYYNRHRKEELELCSRALLGSWQSECARRRREGKEIDDVRTFTLHQVATNIFDLQLTGVEKILRGHKMCDPSHDLHESVKAILKEHHILEKREVAHLEKQRVKYRLGPPIETKLLQLV